MPRESRRRAAFVFTATNYLRDTDHPLVQNSLVGFDTVADFDSTLIRRAKTAVTFPDMVEFAATLEVRPFVQLLEELPEIAKLSHTKFSVVSNVLRRRFRQEQPIDQEQLRVFGMEIAGRMIDRDLAERVRSIFEED